MLNNDNRTPGDTSAFPVMIDLWTDETAERKVG